MFLALGLDKSLSTTECGDLEENIYEVHWTECSPICSPGQLSSAVEEMISAKKRCLYFFSTLPSLFHANGRINEANIFFYETTFLQEMKNWHVIITNIYIARESLSRQGNPP